MTTLVFYPGFHNAGVPFVQGALRLCHNLLGSMGVAYVDPSLYADRLHPVLRVLDEDPDPGVVDQVRHILLPIVEQYKKRGYGTILFCDPFLCGDPDGFEQYKLYPGFEGRMEALKLAFFDCTIKAFLSMPMPEELVSNAPSGYWPKNPDGLNPSRMLGVIGTIFGRDKIGVAFYSPDRPETVFYSLLEFIGISRDDHWKVVLPPKPTPPAHAVSPDLKEYLRDRFGPVYEQMAKDPIKVAAHAPL